LDGQYTKYRFHKKNRNQSDLIKNDIFNTFSDLLLFYHMASSVKIKTYHFVVPLFKNIQKG